MSNVELKKQTALKFVNKILVNMGKDQINDLLDFKDVHRDVLIDDSNKAIVDEMEPELIEHFDKKKLGYYTRNMIKTILITYLRGICEELGYKFISNKKEVSYKIDGKPTRRTEVFYSIK